MAEIAQNAAMEEIPLSPGKYSLVKYFKMRLKDSPTGTFVCSSSNRSFKVVDVIADYLRLMWEQLDGKLTSFLKRKLHVSEIRWCLTIPAIWTDTEKTLMRKAAFKAGLIQTEDASEEHFMLVFEPEAAAAWCLFERKNMGMPLLDGESFLVVDAGGGTVDLTSHKLVGEMLKETTVGTGATCGSSEINSAFWNYLKKLCENDSLDKVSPVEALELTNAIEHCKCQVTDYDTIRNIKLPEEVAKLLDSLPKKPLAYVQRPTKMIRLSAPALREIFGPTISAIEDLVHKQFQAIGKSFDYIFLVGGLGSSQLLLRRLEQVFASGTNLAENVRKVIQPASPGMAVIGGAVLLGKDPSLIRFRKMRATYGIGATIPFVPGIHDESKKHTLNDKPGYWCKDVLDKFVVSGEEVQVDKAVIRNYKPQTENQRYMSLAVYISPLNKDIMYVDSGAVRKLGEIVIDMLDTTGGLDRAVEVNMFFGKSELQVSAVESVSQKKYKAVLTFESLRLEYNAPVTVNYHIIFINDVSSSMLSTDVKPSFPWIPHVNRVGALYESCHLFLQSRVGTSDILMHIV